MLAHSNVAHSVALVNGTIFHGAFPLEVKSVVPKVDLCTAFYALRTSLCWKNIFPVLKNCEESYNLNRFVSPPTIRVDFNASQYNKQQESQIHV